MLHPLEELALAYPVKVIAYQMGWNGVKDAAGRLLLQNIGAVGRAYNPACWIERWRDAFTVRCQQPGFAGVVVPDMRYANEYTSFKQAGFRLVKVVRPDNPQALQGAAAQHPSETELDSVTDWDAVLVNDSTLEDLAANVKVMVEHFAKG
jgi:hypothetical protein